MVLFYLIISAVTHSFSFGWLVVFLIIDLISSAGITGGYEEE